MANTTLTVDKVAREALLILNNELGVLNSFHRAFEEEWQNSTNGYKSGATVRIRRPADFTVRSGAVMDKQDVIEGRTNLTIDQQKGIDFEFSSTDLTLSMENLNERVIKPAMVSLVNGIAQDCMDTFYPAVYNWAGTYGETINSFIDFAKGPERLDEMAVPMTQRNSWMSPSDYWAMVGAQAGLGASDKLVGDAWKTGKLTGLAGFDGIYMTQVTPTHTNGSAVDTNALVDDAGTVEVTYDTAKNTWTQTLNTDTWGNSQTLAAGSVFTIADVYMVNPKTKAATTILQQFTVVTATTTHASGGDTPITISPPIIVTGPHQTVNATAANDAAITLVGAASTGYRQNMCYHKNAFACAFAPMEIPQGAVNVSRQSMNGISVRVIPVYDGINDNSAWRLDVLYGRKCIDPRLASRLSGTG
ncbi:MAG: hypothetical protein GY807_21045 [Gammaproteobacteria bacterium]|nr:hypothetical protein [Gammaproteobacteria bacterium]